MKLGIIYYLNMQSSLFIWDFLNRVIFFHIVFWLKGTKRNNARFQMAARLPATAAQLPLLSLNANGAKHQPWAQIWRMPRML